MTIKSALFACVVAASLGCRNNRTESDLGHARPIEATEPAAGEGAGAAASEYPEHVADPRIDQAGTVNENTGADVQGRRARITRRGHVARPVAPPDAPRVAEPAPMEPAIPHVARPTLPETPSVAPARPVTPR